MKQYKHEVVIMKKLLVALLLVSGTVNAEEWWESSNKSGGKIVLLSEKCTQRPDATTLKRMYAAHKDGETYWGCWNFWSGQVHVVYDDGVTYTYDPAGFVQRITK